MNSLEEQFVEGAARAMFVQAWADEQENPPEELRRVKWHDRTTPASIYGSDGVDVGVWGERQPQGHREFNRRDGSKLYLFDDEVDSDEPAGPVSFSGQELMDVAPPTPEYARFEAAKLLGRLEQANPQWGGNLASIMAAAARAFCISADSVFRDSDFPNAQLTEEDQYLFGHYIAMQALGHGVSWFDDHASFELRVPHVEFELE